MFVVRAAWNLRDDVLAQPFLYVVQRGICGIHIQRHRYVDFHHGGPWNAKRLRVQLPNETLQSFREPARQHVSPDIDVSHAWGMLVRIPSVTFRMFFIVSLRVAALP